MSVPSPASKPPTGSTSAIRRVGVRRRPFTSSAAAGTGGEGGGAGAASGAAGSSSSTAAAAAAAGSGSGSGSGTTERVVAERLAAFAPCVLPALMEEEEDWDGADVAFASSPVLRGTASNHGGGGAGKDEEDEAEEPGWVTAIRTRPPTAAKTHLVVLAFTFLDFEVDRVEPCAVLECWQNPASMQGDCRKPMVDLLINQYNDILRRSPQEHIYTSYCFSNVDDARAVIEAAQAMRAKTNGRLVVHYNGHGMLGATTSGEVWMLDSRHQHFVPFGVAEFEPHLDHGPVIFVLDVNSAGSVLSAWYEHECHIRKPNVFFLCACGDGEKLPRAPALPADLLTSCLTTPVKMALEWYLYRSPHDILLPNVSVESIRAIAAASSATPLYRDLNHALNAVLDTVAWCTLKKGVFQALFRRDDLTTKTIFRHFVLAIYVGNGAGVHPVSHPSFSDAAGHHYMFDCWEYTLERALAQLPNLEKAIRHLPFVNEEDWRSYVPSTFFDEQLTAFQLWVERGGVQRRAGERDVQPDMLPCVLQSLGRGREQRAIPLLIRYMESGRHAAATAMRCGLLPYLSLLYVRRRAIRLCLVLAAMWMQCVRVNPKDVCAEMMRTGYRLEWLVGVLRLPKESEVVLECIGDDDAAMQQYINGGGIRRHRPAQEGVSGAAAGAERSMPNNPAGAAAAARGGGEPLQPVGGRGGGGLTTAGGPPPKPVLAVVAGLDLNRAKSIVCYTLCQLQRVDGLLCWNAGVLEAAFAGLGAEDTALCSWSCLLLAGLFQNVRHAKYAGSQYFTPRIRHATDLLRHTSPIVRASCVTLLGSFVGARLDRSTGEDAGQQMRQVQMEKKLLIQLRPYMTDASMAVRHEMVYFAVQILHAYYTAVEKRPIETVQAYVFPPASHHTAAADNTPRTEAAAGEQPSPPLEGSKQPHTPCWKLQEVEVRVQSALHAQRPTDNAQFADTVSFDTHILSADDPEPSGPLLLEGLDPVTVVPVLEGLVHDSTEMLRCMYYYGDTKEVEAQLQDLAAGLVPTSGRLAAEARRTMRRVVPNTNDSQMGQVPNPTTTTTTTTTTTATASSVTGAGGAGRSANAAGTTTNREASEAERTRARWNNDAMKQIVMDMEDRRLEPPSNAGSSSGGGIRLPNSSSTSAMPAAGGWSMTSCTAATATATAAGGGASLTTPPSGAAAAALTSNGAESGSGATAPLTQTPSLTHASSAENLSVGSLHSPGRTTTTTTAAAAAATPSNGATTLPSPRFSAAGAGTGTALAGSSGSGGRIAASCYQLLHSTLHRRDPVIASAFRTLESQVVMATKGQLLYTISYDSYHRQEILSKHALRLPSPVRRLHVINDLSEQNGVLVVTKQGGFVVLKNTFHPPTVLQTAVASSHQLLYQQQQPYPNTNTSKKIHTSREDEDEAAVPHVAQPLREVGTFSACATATSRSSLPVQSTYLQNSATLLYGGPIGPEGAVELHTLSLVEEQVVQQLRVAGTAALTALTANSSSRAVFAGFDNGVVRYYDDRQGSGQIGAVAEGRCGPALRRGSSSFMGASNSSTSHSGRNTISNRRATAAAVLGLGPVLTGSGFTVVAADAEECCIFDMRKWREPVEYFHHSALYTRAGLPNAAASSSWASNSLMSPISAPDGSPPMGAPPPPSAAGDGSPMSSLRAPLLTRCSVSPYTGLLAISFDDDTYGAFNTKGQLLCERLQSITGRRMYPDTFNAHPLRPFLSMNADLMFL